MISKEDFLGKIRTEILLSQSLADEKKKKCILFIEIFLAFLGTMSCLYAFFYIRESNPFVALLIFAILCFCINMHVWRYFKEKQKKAFYPIALKLLDHLKNKKIAFSIRDITGLLEQTCLFHRFLMIHLNHLIDGSFKGKHFFIAELYTRDRHGTRIDIRDTLFGKRYFQGVCIDIPLDKKLSGYVFLVDKKRDFSFLEKNKLKVELNDASFEKEVSAYSNDPENARILLTPDFINKMKMLKKCFQNKMVEISFFKKHAFIVIETKDGLFRPCLENKEAPNTRSYEEFYDRYKRLTHAIIDNPCMFGLCYTQLTDVEQEQNGLFTYDTREPKFDLKVLKKIMKKKAAIEK